MARCGLFQRAVVWELIIFALRGFECYCYLQGGLVTLVLLFVIICHFSVDCVFLFHISYLFHLFQISLHYFLFCVVLVCVSAGL